MLTYPTHKEFVLALRPRVKYPFLFVVPKVEVGEPKVIDICCTVDGHVQWCRFPLILTEAQIDFIAKFFNDRVVVVSNAKFKIDGSVELRIPE